MRSAIRSERDYYSLQEAEREVAPALLSLADFYGGPTCVRLTAAQSRSRFPSQSVIRLVPAIVSASTRSRL
jgi:hypothetical protein